MVDTDLSELIHQKNLGFMEGMDFFHVMMNKFCLQLGRGTGMWHF
jgi:hypothetical protein